MVELAKSGQSFAELDERFHRGLLQPVGNQVLEALLSLYWTVFDHLVDSTGGATDDTEIACMHGRIIDAIEAGDVPLAAHELDAHFYGIRRRFPDLRLRWLHQL
jgi:DNA-binding FadR family transcriptional regulator